MAIFVPHTGRRRSLLVAVMIILGIVIVAAGSAWTAYQSRQQEVDRLNQQTQQLNGEVARLKGDITTLQSKPTEQATPVTDYFSSKGVKVRVYAPAKDTKVTSPVAVVGEVPGSWSFEASFPVKLIDGSGKTIAQGPAQLLGDWMTDQLVPFSAKLTYPGGAPSGNGTLRLEKDNPSGQPSNDDSVAISVKL